MTTTTTALISKDFRNDIRSFFAYAQKDREGQCEKKPASSFVSFGKKLNSIPFSRWQTGGGNEQSNRRGDSTKDWRRQACDCTHEPKIAHTTERKIVVEACFILIALTFRSLKIQMSLACHVGDHTSNNCCYCASNVNNRSV